MSKYLLFIRRSSASKSFIGAAFATRYFWYFWTCDSGWFSTSWSLICKWIALTSTSSGWIFLWIILVTTSFCLTARFWLWIYHPWHWARRKSLQSRLQGEKRGTKNLYRDNRHHFPSVLQAPCLAVVQLTPLPIALTCSPVGPRRKSLSTYKQLLAD